jgi:hypothetical protein
LERSVAKNLLPKNVLEEYRRLMTAARGNQAKHAHARRFVFTTVVARYGNAWWQANHTDILSELDAVDAKVREG